MKQVLCFTASWCPHCEEFKPIIKKLTIPYNIEVLDVDDNQDLAVYYDVENLPSIVFLKDNLLLDKREGGFVENEDELEKYIKNTYQKY